MLFLPKIMKQIYTNIAVCMCSHMLSAWSPSWRLWPRPVYDWQLGMINYIGFCNSFLSDCWWHPLHYHKSNWSASSSSHTSRTTVYPRRRSTRLDKQTMCHDDLFNIRYWHQQDLPKVDRWVAWVSSLLWITGAKTLISICFQLLYNTKVI